MHKVLIIDDDRIIRKGLITTIPWEKYGFQIIGEAPDGEQGLKIIEECHPHIVISDIKMPFMDGLDMAHIIRERYPTIKVILLTGYNDFNYAHKAIKVRAFDYLLKPIDKEILLEKVQKAAVEWDEENKAQRRISEANPFYRQTFFKKILEHHGAEDEEDLLQEARSLGIELTGQTFIVLLIKIDEYDKGLEKTAEFSQQREVLKYCVFNICEELIHMERKGGVVELESDELILIYSSHESFEQAEEKARVLAEEIKNTVKKYVRTTLTVVLGGAYQGICSIDSSYREARSALAFRHLIGKDKVFSMIDIEIFPDNHNDIQIKGKEHEFINNVKLGFVQEALGVLNDLEIEMMQQNYISLHNVRILSVQLIIALFRGAAEWGKGWENTHQANVASYYSQINGMQTISEIMNLLRQVTCDLSQFIITQRESQGGCAVGEAAKYIEEHYAKQGLSLQEIAKHVHMNPVYMSVLFKQEKNVTFSDFLLQLRMKNAMEMLRCHNMKTYEVAEAVGYGSPEYFSVCFKKYTGVSPTEFKNKV